jgi:hypothetical protein
MSPLPSREILVAVRELDERGSAGRAFITQTDYLTRTERTTVNKSFTASGRLEVTLTPGWEQHPVLSQRDSGKARAVAVSGRGFRRAAELPGARDCRSAAAPRHRDPACRAPRVRIVLQPGGHLEPADVMLSGAAERELAEETGINPGTVFCVSQTHVYVEYGRVRARPEKDEPDHFHLDSGYLYGLFRLSIHPLQGRDSLGYGRAVVASGCP